MYYADGQGLLHLALQHGSSFLNSLDQLDPPAAGIDIAADASGAAYSMTEPAATAWSSIRDLDTAAYSRSQLPAQLPGTSDEWDRRGEMLADSQDSGPQRQHHSGSG